jgi:hypothetical protein
MGRYARGDRYDTLTAALAAWGRYNNYDEGTLRSLLTLQQAADTAIGPASYFSHDAGNGKYVTAHFESLRNEIGIYVAWGYLSLSRRAMHLPGGGEVLVKWAEAQGWDTQPESPGGCTIWLPRGRRSRAAK